MSAVLTFGERATSTGVGSRIVGRVVGHATPSGSEVIPSNLDRTVHNVLQPDPILQSITSGAKPTPPQELVRRLHQRSGLTWEQLAKVFGVSRRALHLWASGGRMNAHNHEVLADLMGRVEALHGTTPAEKRAALLQPRGDRPSLFDELRSARASKDHDINRAPFEPYEMFGVGGPVNEA